MTHVAVTVLPETTLVAAAGAMVRNRVHRLAATDARQVLVGLISSMDIVRAVAESTGGGT
ncbi:MAG: CBS domain-containing protein [Planctomycetes bacterium]|nr:CBS domain-containing protein [Planctomycetota bacterium]